MATTEWNDFVDQGVFELLVDSDTKQPLGEADSTLTSHLNLKSNTTTTIQYISDSDSTSNLSSSPSPSPTPRLLVVSPYTTPTHLLDLTSVSAECQLVARSLVAMRPIRPDYATAPYDQAFNWDELVTKHLQHLLLTEDARFAETRFYIVVFRSQVPRSTDRSKLGVLDELAHEEAMQSGGLLKYWFGTPDREGRNLATCVWRHRDDARLGGAGPGHAKAMQETKALYTEWQVERLSLTVGKEGQSWSITKWSD